MFKIKYKNMYEGRLNIYNVFTFEVIKYFLDKDKNSLKIQLLLVVFECLFINKNFEKRKIAFKC